MGTSLAGLVNSSLRRNEPGTPWPTGRYRVADHIYLTGDGQPAADKLTLQPIIIRRAITVDRIGIRLVTAQTGGAIRLGIYRTDPATDLPGALFADAGEVTLSGSTGLKTATVSWLLAPGVYWLAAINKGGGTLPTIRRISGALMGRVQGTDDSEISTGNGYRYLEAAQAYGALPSTAPAATPSAGTDGPAITLRRA